MSGPVVLSWPERPGAIAYRVVVWRTDTEEYHKFEVPDGSCRIPPDTLSDRTAYEWRAEFRDAHDADWQQLFSYVAMPQDEPPSPGIALAWPADGATAYRVLVRSEAQDAIVAKVGTVRPGLVLDPESLPAGPLTYRLQHADGATWADWTDYTPLPAPAIIDHEPVRAPTVTARVATPLERRPPGPRALLLFTCDTEVNMRMMRDPDPGRAFDEQIYARVGDRHVGIHALMDLLDEHQVTGTFFVDVLMRFQFGERPVREVCEAVLERGHDVQLHLHPAPHLRFADEPSLRELHAALTRDDPTLFGRALHVGLETFEQLTGRLPVAYRSGAYHLCDAFLPVLEEHGIAIDSSLYPFRNCRVAPWMWTRTQPFWVGNVLELPITWLLRDRADGLSFEQLSAVLHPRAQNGIVSDLRPPAEGPPLVLTYIAHSYSLLGKDEDDRPDAAARWNAAVQRFWPPEEYELARLAQDSEVRFYAGPDERRIASLTDFIAGVAGRGDVEGISLAELHARGPRTFGFDATPRLADPLPEWHDAAAAGRLTVAQRYSSWYLEYLEQTS